MTSTNNELEQRAAGQPYPCRVIRDLAGASACWWDAQPRGYWVWSRRLGREFFPLEDAGDRTMLNVWVALRRAAESAYSPRSAGVSA